jgi:hypothetical protein
MPMFAWALVLMVASYVISSFLIKQPTVKPASSDEIDFPQEEEGTPQSVLFGDGWTKGYQTVWHGNIRTKKIKGGGKK